MKTLHLTFDIKSHWCLWPIVSSGCSVDLEHSASDYNNIYCKIL